MTSQPKNPMLRYTGPVLLALALSLSGCATTKQTISPNLRIVDLPPLNEERISELGETLVQKGKVYTYEAVRLENTVTAGDGFLLKKFTLSPGILKASMRDDERIYYTTDKLAVYDAILGTSLQSGGLAVNQKDEKDIRFHLNGVAVMRPKPDPVLTKTQVADVDHPSFRQELIYNGRSGDTLKFLYREYTSDLLRAPFSQEIQYDLKDGSTIGFKGARIEVMEATNTKLKYRVVASFPDAS
jgi:hypothetical protein